MSDRPIIQADFVKPLHVPSRKVLQLVFEVPEEAGDHAMAILGGIPLSGTNRWCAIARLADKPATESAAEAQDEPTAPEATPAKLKGGPICKRAVLLGKNADFRNWWMGFSAMHNDAERLVKERMYRDFNIISRAELDHNVPAAREFENLERQYYDSQRGWDTQGESR